MEKRKANIERVKMRLRNSKKSKLMGISRIVRKFISVMVSCLCSRRAYLKIFQTSPGEKGDQCSSDKDKPPLQKFSENPSKTETKKVTSDDNGHFKYQIKDFIFHCKYFNITLRDRDSTEWEWSNRLVPSLKITNSAC